ncbi:MAG TPA: 6-pyruvoyl-tetrahydropterin synthase-related protein [Vicinamibacterales bacterium]|nr:6-pyruvoyl-tetrahydropterin synthase-related protein [Vicinamibacterales bacterium]
MVRVATHAAYVAVLLSIVPLATPVLLPDFLVGHDAAAHQTYAFLFDRALAQGQFPVRWVEGVADGLGQPLFNHYQVGFYYLVALVHWIGLDLSVAFKLTIAGAWAGGAAFMFLLCRPLGSLPAALAAAVFVWSPYLLLDVYVRSAYPELTAIALAPGVLWAMDGVLRTGRRIFACALGLMTALLLISHPPTALIVAPLGAAYLAGCWFVHRPPARLFRLVILGAVVGAGMAAFYILPAILQIDAIHSASMTTGYFDYHKHFVQPEWWFDRSWGYGGSGEGANDQMSMQLGIVQWIVIGAAFALLASAPLRRRLPLPPVAVAGWLSVVGLALFMMTEPSAVVWETVAPLAFVQFPWRLLMLPTIACGVLAAVVLSSIRHRTVQAVLVLCAVAWQWQLTEPYREIASRRPRAAMTIDDPAWPASDSARRWGFREPAYDPITVRVRNAPAPGRWTATGGTEVSAIRVTDTRMELAVASREPVKLVINTPFYPGWRTTVDGRSEPPLVDPSSGYLVVDVPAGVHRVSASFGRDTLRTIAELISLPCLLALLVIAILR